MTISEEKKRRTERLILAEERLQICYDCPNYFKYTRQCKLCKCFMPLKTLLKRSKCPDNPPRWE